MGDKQKALDQILLRDLVSVDNLFRDEKDAIYNLVDFLRTENPDKQFIKKFCITSSLLVTFKGGDCHDPPRFEKDSPIGYNFCIS